MNTIRHGILICCLCALLAPFAVSCAGSPTPPPATPTITEPPLPMALPAGPLPVKFTAADGVEVEGMYYPAAVMPAPVVVLMHGGGESQHLWDAIAPWLENRGTVFSGDEAVSYLDPSWFPAVPSGRSYAVFTFTSARPYQEFLTDAEAAIKAARGLEGVDPDRMVLVGSSSGADGAIDSCAQGCIGVFALSPGNYLGKFVIQEVMRLNNATPPVPVMCLASNGDPGPSALTCQSSEGENVGVRLYEGASHGVEMFRPDLDPQPLQLLLDFLLRVTGS